jgi:hypothetical protein
MSQPDTFNLENYKLSEDNTSAPTAVRRYKRQERVRFYQFSTEVMDKLFTATRCPALAVLLALEDLWFTDFDHRNPIKLTSYNLQRFGLSRGQKYRALKALETAKLISVDRINGKNPVVMLLWRPPAK